MPTDHLPQPRRSVGRTALLGIACGACCALPMLLVAGVVSLSALLVGGVAVGAVVALSALAIYWRFVVADRRPAGRGGPPLQRPEEGLPALTAEQDARRHR